MSPNESQLRAALHDGEGQNVDYGALLAHAEGVRLARRRRINLAAAASVVVALVGVGTAVIVASSGGNSGGGAAASRLDHGTATGGGAPASGRPAPADRAGGGAHAENRTSCAPGAPRVAASAGGLRSAALFPSRVGTITVCGYPSGAAPRGVVLTGAPARALAAAIDRAPSRDNVPTQPCRRRDYRTGRIALHPVTPDGRSAPEVVITVSCAVSTATNGTGVRYLTNLPAAIAALMR